MVTINTSNITTLGNAFQDTNGKIRLTNSEVMQSGAVQFNDNFMIVNDKDINFNVNFSFKIDDVVAGNDPDGLGADGFTFFLAPKIDAPGAFGFGMGYGGIDNSLAVEFDTNINHKDVDGNHIGLNLNGQLESIIATPVSERMNNGQVWNAWIDYSGTNKNLEVRLSTGDTKPVEANMVAEIDLLEVLPQGQDLYFGFTGATGGGAHEYHDILSSEITFEEVVKNTAPIANNDSANVNEDSTAIFNVLDNDTDADGNTLVIRKIDSSTANVGSKIILASGAFVTVNQNGTTTYDPNGKFDYLNEDETANDTFTYQVSDSKGDTDTATVTIRIDGEGSVVINPNDPVNFKGGNGDETIRSGNGSDRIDAGAGNDTINTGGGIDTVRAGIGNDTIDAGAGNDTVYGHLGNDTIYSGDGDDYVSGGEGNDKIYSSLGKDVLRGGEDSDMFIFTNFDHSTKIEKDLIIDFEKGSDKIDFSALGIESFNEITIKNVFTTGKKVNITFAEDADFSLNIEFADFIAGTQLSANDFMFASPELA